MQNDQSTAGMDTVQLLQMVMDNIPQHIFWKDRNSVYLGCNENFARVAGVENPESIVGKNDFDLAWKEDEARFFRKIDQEVMGSGIAQRNIVEPQLQSDGREAWLETNKIPLRDETGKVIGILGMFQDITARKRAEEALNHTQRMEMIGRLAGGVAHDFNNMLTGIMGMSDLLQEELEDRTELQRHAECILETSKRAAELTAKLLMFSRRGKMEHRAVNVHRAIENVVDLLRRSVPQSITVKTELEASEFFILGDPAEIESALLNLGVNARDAMPDGGTITFSTSIKHLGMDESKCSEFQRRASQYLQIAVRDAGVGIEPDVMRRLFEPFFTTKANKGTGLGLAAVYGAVSTHEGAIFVRSTLGQGATFFIELPLAEDTAVPAQAQRKPTFQADGKILVVDDQPTIRNTLIALLEDIGFQVEAVATGTEAVARVKTRDAGYSVVLIDVVMPGMGGITCFKLIRQAMPELPVIMMSGFTEDQTMAEITEDRLASFLKKPFGKAGIIAALQSASCLH